MEFTFVSRLFRQKLKSDVHAIHSENNLTYANIDETYIIKGIHTDDEEMKNFLFTLGCYEGEEVTVISLLSDNFVIHIKGARYSIDKELAKAILI